MPNNKKIKVLIVEDTQVGQTLLKGLLSYDPRFGIIGLVTNGKQAVEFIAHNRPDVVSMDIYMPVMDGVDATRLIMENTPVPIVIVSSAYDSSEVMMSFRILEAGALTIMPRPFGPGHPQFEQTARNYRNTLKMMSEVTVKSRIRTKPKVEQHQALVPQSPVSPCKIIAIGASAGGPQITQVILNGLPKGLSVPIIIVQHIDLHFAEGYRDWLGNTTHLPVHIARNDETMIAGHVYLPPGDRHIGIKKEGIIAVGDDLPIKGLRPAVSYLFNSLCKVYGASAMAILLSGMGTDGAIEMKLLYDMGAFTIAQDAESSLVHGMPGEAIRLGGASRIMNPEEIIKEILNNLQYQK